ncbi:sugar transferase, PEP-CTERM/EpsH1 system associated [Methylomagnum ishizawai]|uniref:Sugar transferase, PEP-CTERM/EpsH1 system associated n=1 Tax=Methylomagnum ishizawai TaxID=1760988 RepID=A0A1Y6D450_9GAMM|nr:TIGR03087 family PEP-CTERM/XrtA system glycosyltransferase [Methylomagnum ishizawai]SMF94735.1 sugar transferase, PEP-CTERM/EpsH1 system associated [Methylomagnum ishizawai]
MKDILFLAHRIPFPPNKGDKIRSFHWLKYLSESYRVHLGAFVDDPEDLRHIPEVECYCAGTCLLPLHPKLAKLRGLKGLVSGAALSIPYYADRRMSAWVDGLLARTQVAGILVFSSAMAQYAEPHPAVPCIVDFVDVDSDKWRQYAGNKPWPTAWIYRREAKKLLDFDRRVAAHATHALFVSEHEAGLFKTLAPEVAARVRALENGVDTDYFNPGQDYPNPYPEDVKPLVFTGAMDYWANVDAVAWFADAVWPALRRECPQARFYVVGSRPTAAVAALGRRDGIVVTGAVPDVRPYLHHARCAVAPLRIARGIQNKVLEALALAKPVLASSPAMEGIECGSAPLAVRVVDGAESWRSVALDLLRDAALPAVVPENRSFVLERYGWSNSLARLGGWLEAL